MYKQLLTPLLAWLAFIPSVLAQTSPTAITLTPAEHAWLAAHPIIRLGTDKNWMPYVKQLENGDIVGVEPDLIARINALTGANIRLELGVWAEMVKQAERGELDGLALSSAQPEREAHFLFSTSLYSVSRYIYTRGGHTSPFHSMADLAGKKVGIQRGGLAQEKILARWPAIIPVPTDSPRDLSVALLNGEIDAALGAMALRNLLREELFAGIDIAFAIPNSETHVLYSIRKEHPELLSIINKALAVIGPAGSLEILAKWGANYEAPTAKVVLTEAERAWLATHPDIRLGSSSDFVPYIKVHDNGQVVGIEPDVLARIKALTGANIRLILGQWAEIVKQAERGELDGLAVSSAQPERATQFFFSTSVYSSAGYIYARKGKSLRSMEDLAGKKVGFLGSSLAQRKLLAKWPAIIPVEKASGQEIAVALLNGELDGGIGSIGMRLMFLQNTYPDLDIAFVVPGSETKLVYSIRKEHPELLSIINKALAAMGPAEIQQILAKWGANYEAPTPKVVLTEVEQAWIKARPEIWLGGGDGTFIPYAKREENGNIVGIEPDLLARFNALTGANLRLVLGPWAELIKQAERGELEGLALSIAHPERAEQFLFSNSPYSNSLYIYTRGGISSPWHSMEELAGKKVGLLRGALLHQKHLARWPAIIPVPLDSAKMAGLALLNGEIDAVIAGIVLRQMWRSELLPGLDIAFPVPNSSTPMIYSIRKESPELLSIINKALAAMDPAEIQQILAKWGAIYDTSAPQVVLTETERAWIKAHPEIHLGIDKGWTPFVKLQGNGDIMGIEPDLLARINALTGAKIQLVLGNWTEMVAQAERGELHGLAMSAAHPERAERFLFSSSPYSTSRFVYALSHTATTLHSMEDLAGKRVGFTAGNLAEKKLLAKWPQIIPVPLSSARELAVALMNRDIEAAISGITLLRTIRDELLPDLTIALIVPESETKLLYSVGKEYPELLSIINKALAAISPAEVQGILEKWGAVYNTPSTELVLTAEEQAWLREHPKIVLGSTDQFQPYLIVKPDGGYEGLVVDYLKLLNQQLGNRLKLHVESDWSKVTDQAIQHEIDGLAVSTPNPTWDQHFLYTEPYNLAYYYLYLRADATNNVTKTADLAGQRVGYLAGVKKIEYLLRDVPNVKRFAFNDNEALVNALLEEQVDLLIGTTNLEWWRKQHGNFAFKTAGLLTDSLHPLVMSIRNDWNILPGILNKALNNIPSAEQERIRQRWLGGTDNQTKILLSAEERVWLAEHPRLRYCFSPVWKPYDYFEQGEHQGIFKDYLEVFAKKLGVSFVPVPTPIPDYPGKGWQQALDFAKERRCDFISGAVRIPEREGYLSFSTPYFEITQVLIAKADKPFISGLQAIPEQTVGVPPGTAIQKILQRDFPQIHQVVLDTSQAAEALDHGDIYAYVTSLEHAIRWLNERVHNYKIIGKLDYPYPISVAVRNDWPPLLNLMNKVVTTMTPAEHNDIRRKWTTYTLEEQVNYTLLWQLTGTALLIIGLILYWNRRLTKEIILRKQTESNYREISGRLEKIADRIPGVVYEFQLRPDGSSCMPYASPALRDLFEISPTDVHEDTAPVLAAIHPEDYHLVMTSILESAHTLQPWQLDFRTRFGDGRVRWIRGDSLPQRQPDGTVLWHGFMANITERKQAELDLIQARDAAEAANRAKSAFIANMSHELRTPLNAVLGFAQILQQDPILGNLQREQVQRIQRGGEYLLTLINDILDLAKIEAGRFELFPDAWDTQGVFQELGHIFRLRTEQKSIIYRYEQVMPLPRTLYCDDKRLRQILINLLGNAVKFTEHGGVTLRTGYESGKLWLEVVDTGIGIAMADFGKIFEPFHQTGTDHYKMQGTGLGLAITHRLVQAMGGTLQVESIPGQGSMFHVEIPAEVVSTTKVHLPAEQPTVIGYCRLGDGGPLRILVVDDLADNRGVIRYLLEPLGFVVEEANSGQRCLDRVSDYQPDVIFMDLRMPGMDGLQVTRILRAQGFKMPIIVLSASTFAEDRAASLNAGCTAHLAKPVRLSEILEILAQSLPLKWKYADTPLPVEKENRALETLPAEQAKQVRMLCQIGDIFGLKEFTEQLEKSYPQLAQKIDNLLNSFEFDEIEKLMR